MVSVTPRPHFTPGKETVSILQEAGWAPGPVWTGGKSRPPRDSIPDRPARSQSLYRLSYPAHKLINHRNRKQVDGLEVAGNGLGSCPVADFGICCVKTPGSVTNKRS